MFLLGCGNADNNFKKEMDEMKNKLAETKKALATASNDETTFIHTVFFWMNENVTDEQKADFAKNGLEELKKIKSLHKVYYGPAAMTPREVVDNSYDFAWICHFKSSEDQDAYQEDPMHLKFIEDYKHLWKRVQVYDNLVK